MSIHFSATIRIPACAAATFALLLGAMMVTAALPVTRPQPSIDELKWIIGCWTMQTARGSTITERWTRAAPDTLAGTSRTTRDGATIASEVMHIFARADTIIFAALPSGQSYTEFRASTVSASAAVFDNAAHDFPQRVSYRSAPDSLHGRIEGTLNGAFRSVDFPMRRTSCDG